MRETKFRGKRKDTGEWVYGYYSKDTITNLKNEINPNVYTIRTPYKEGFTQDYPVDPKTVGEFTGLHDKNGKEIWEKSLIYFTNLSKEDLFVIEWDNTEARFVVIKTADTTWKEPLGGFNLDFIEVIGNIEWTEPYEPKEQSDDRET
jgi:uncharacterized phage protein (TIGR01671 family)